MQIAASAGGKTGSLSLEYTSPIGRKLWNVVTVIEKIEIDYS
jgi:hypothetical protein